MATVISVAVAKTTLLLLLPLTASLSLLADGFIKLFHDTFGLAPSQLCSNLEMLSLSSDDRLVIRGGFFVMITSVFDSDFESILFDAIDAVDDDGDKGEAATVKRLGSGFEGFEVPLVNGRAFASRLLGLDAGRCWPAVLATIGVVGMIVIGRILPFELSLPFFLTQLQSHQRRVLQSSLISIIFKKLKCNRNSHFLLHSRLHGVLV